MLICNNVNYSTTNFKGQLDYSHCNKDIQDKLKKVEPKFERLTKENDGVLTFSDNFDGDILCGDENESEALCIKFNKNYSINNFLNESQKNILNVLTALAEAGVRASKNYTSTTEYVSKIEEIYPDYLYEGINIDNKLWSNSADIDILALKQKAEKDENKALINFLKLTNIEK